MPTYMVLPVIAIIAIVLANTLQLTALGLSALPLAILLGMIYGHFATSAADDLDQPFLQFCKQKMLRLGIILFGFGLSFQQILAVGWQAIVIDLLVITTVLIVGIWVGIKVLKLPRDVAILTAAGSAICGAAAILATESVLKPKQQHITVAIATVVLFGTLAMFSYPLIYKLATMNDQSFGIYIGSTVHEVAQAVAAGQSINGETMETAVVVKLIRVMMLAPFLLILTVGLSWFTGDNTDEQKGKGHNAMMVMPWFVFAFIAAAMVNSVVILPEMVKSSLALASQFALALAMAALGAHTRWATIKAAGIKPLLLALLLFVILLGGGYFLTSWLC